MDNNKLIKEKYEYFKDLKRDSNSDFDQFQGYNLFFNNCVQVCYQY